MIGCIDVCGGLDLFWTLFGGGLMDGVGFVGDCLAILFVWDVVICFWWFS